MSAISVIIDSTEKNILWILTSFLWKSGDNNDDDDDGDNDDDDNVDVCKFILIILTKGV